MYDLLRNQIIEIIKDEMFHGSDFSFAEDTTDKILTLLIENKLISIAELLLRNNDKE